MTAGDRWARELAAWAIPEEILRAAPASPWWYPPDLFARRADARVARPTPSSRAALEALPGGGVVLDIGCGAGAASLPLAGRAGRLIGVDPSPDMPRAFRARGETLGMAVETIEGAWPDAAAQAPAADVAVCHHVAYNVPDLAPFVRELDGHARRRVVLELTARHPASALNSLWLRFHGLARPEGPTADDAVAVLREAGIEPSRADWVETVTGPFAARDDLVAWIRRRLCLPAARDAEIAQAIAPDVVERDGLYGLTPRPIVTLWWARSRGQPESRRPGDEPRAISARQRER